MIARRPRRGVEAIEFALTMPLWLGLVWGIADVAWLLHERSVFASAVERGCRAAAQIDPGDDGGNLKELRRVARARTLGWIRRVEPSPCASCQVDVRIEGERPMRRLVCEGRREAHGLTVWWFDASPVTATRSVWLEWQREAAPWP